MLFTSALLVAMLPLTLASPFPSRALARDIASDLVTPIETLAADVTSGDTSVLFTDTESTVSSLLGGVIKREAATSTSTSTSTASSGLGGLLSPVTSLLGGILRRNSPLEGRGLFDSATETLATTTTAIGSDVSSPGTVL